MEFGCCQATLKQEYALNSACEGWKINPRLRELFVSIYRCNNVLYIRGVEEEEEDGEMRE